MAFLAGLSGQGGGEKPLTPMQTLANDCLDSIADQLGQKLARHFK